MFHEHQFTSKATVGQLKEEICERTGYYEIKLYCDGVMLTDNNYLVKNLRLFEGDIRERGYRKGGRMYYCPVSKYEKGREAKDSILN